MNRARHKTEQALNKRREAETMLAGGRTVAQMLQHQGVIEGTFSRWQKQCGVMES